MIMDAKSEKKLVVESIPGIFSKLERNLYSVLLSVPRIIKCFFSHTYDWWSINGITQRAETL